MKISRLLQVCEVLARDKSMYRALLALPCFARSVSVGRRVDYMIEFGHTVDIRANYTEYRLLGQKHRADGPAFENDRGQCYWYVRGQLHRADGPAIHGRGATSAMYWYVRGQLHREDGPAIVSAYEVAWYIRGQLHRADGPAEVCRGMSEKWYYEGRLHRADGPAITYMCGNRYYYRHGVEVAPPPDIN